MSASRKSLPLIVKNIPESKETKPPLEEPVKNGGGNPEEIILPKKKDIPEFLELEDPVILDEIEPPNVGDIDSEGDTPKPPLISDDPGIFDPPPIISEPTPGPSEDEIQIKQENESTIELEIAPQTTYFFVFGLPAAGKSVMVSGLIHYLRAFSEGQVYPIGSADKNNHRRGDYVYAEMTKSVRKGEFVPRTVNLQDDQSLSTEINLEFAPSDVNKDKFPFCILEMAGEDLEKVRLKNFGREGGILDERINAYLEHPDCNIKFICVLDVDNPDDSQDLIDEFLTYARRLGHENNQVLLTVNKWDKVSDQYENVEQYLRNNAEILFKRLYDPEREYEFMPFSIGPVDAVGRYGYQYQDSKKLFEWMYEVGIGEPLNEEKIPSPVERFISYIKKRFLK